MKKFSHLFNLSKANRRGGKNANHDAAKRSQPSASAFVLESLEQRVLMDATLVDTTAVTTTESAPTAAVVTTDKADYSPGETAVITTSNTSGTGPTFGDGEMVQLQVTRTDGVEDYANGNLPWYVSDGMGGFTAYQEYDANGQAVDRNADGLADWIPRQRSDRQWQHQQRFGMPLQYDDHPAEPFYWICVFNKTVFAFKNCGTG